MILESFRRFSGTFAARALLMALVAAFTAWGVEGFLQARQATTALKTDTVQVSMLELDNLYRQRVRQLENMLGGPASPEQLAQMGLAEQVLAETLARAVLRDNAQKMGLRASAAQLKEEIGKIPVFLDEQGAFNANQYRAMLAQVGQTPTSFEREMNHDLSVRQLAQMIQLANLPPSLTAPLIKAASARYRLAVATVRPQPFTEAPTEAQLEDFYKLNPITYTKPEKRAGQALLIDPEALATNITLPESRIAEAYETNKEALGTPEARVVRHILLASLQEAQQVRGAITDLASFATAADQHSTDPGNTRAGSKQGGQLGAITRDSVVPAFGNVAFTVAPNTLSEPVQSPFGWHLIWVESVTPGRTPTLAEVRGKLEQELKLNEATELATELATQADSRIAAGESLEAIAKQLGVTLRRLPLMEAAETSLDDPLANQLFSLTQVNQVSTPLELGNGGLAYVVMTEQVTPVLPPLNEIRTRVAADWAAMQQELATNRAAEALLAAAQAEATGNRDLQAAVRQAGVTADVNELVISSMREAPRWLQARLNDLAAAPIGQALPAVLREGDVRYVVSLQERTYAPTSEGTPDAAQLQQEITADLEGLVVQSLQQQAHVSCNAAVLRQVFGRDVACPL